MKINNSGPLSISDTHPKRLPSPPYDFRIINTSPYDLQGKNNVCIYTNLTEMVLQNVPAEGVFVMQYVDPGDTGGTEVNRGCRYRIDSNNEGLPMDFFDEAVDHEDDQWWHLPKNATVEVFTTKYDFGGGNVYSLIFPKFYEHREHTFNRGGRTVPTFNSDTFTNDITDAQSQAMQVNLSYLENLSSPGEPRITLPDPVTHDQIMVLDAFRSSAKGFTIRNLPSAGNVYVPPGYAISLRSSEDAIHSTTYKWNLIGQIAPPGASTTEILRYAGRAYLYADARWVTSADDNYGIEGVNMNESGGTGTEPIYEWEQMGIPVLRDDIINKIYIQGRVTDANTIEDLELKVVFVAPKTGFSYTTGISNDNDLYHQVIWEGTWRGGGIGVPPSSVPINHIVRRVIGITGTPMPSAGELRIYYRPVNVDPRPNASTDYFQHSVVMVLQR